MEKLIKGITIGVIMGIILGGITGYFLHNLINRSFIQGRGNFQISDEAKNATESFFASTTNMQDIQNYCNSNRMNCLYYCRSINPNHEICSQFNNSIQRGMSPQ